MKTSHHFLAVLLAVLLCLSLTACGDSSDDVTGDDWRVSGVVAAEGTITHEGEGSVKVLVTVGPESAAFYRDEPEQELFDSVSFPVTVEDANDDGTGFDISFDDITGDGESDVVVTFQHADMSTTQMVWFWDADERYVFEPDYSYFHENGVQTDLTDTPYFSDNGLQINAAVNTGTYLLENGVACYSGLGDGYERNDCYWEVVKHSDQSHDGIREIQFDAICYIPESSIPYFTEQYAYRTGWGLGGRGEFELSEASGRPMIFFNGFLYNFLLRDDGVLLPNQNGEGSGLTIHRHTFLRDDKAEIVEWDKSNWDGMWQNALGETIVIDSSLMQYIACSPDYSMSGTMNDEGEGMGLYLYDNGTRAYLCPSDDGNSFTLSAERFGRYGDDQHFDGVFYRNADFYTYTDMENAEFYEDEYSTFYIWYYDGVNRYLLGNDYTIGDDGLAYHDEDGLVYPAGWIPEAPYDPADDWGENWMDNWDI